MEDILREWRVYESECITPCLNTMEGSWRFLGCSFDTVACNFALCDAPKRGVANLFSQLN